MEPIDLLIVTGATRGIGRAVVTACSEIAGQVIAIGSSDKFPVISGTGKFSNLQLDLSNLEQIESSLQSLIGNVGDLRIGVVLCASQLGSSGGIFEANFNEWGSSYQVNVLGNLAVLQFALRRMTPNSSLRSIFFAGGGAAYGYPDFSGYSLTKVATVRAVENIGLEFAARAMNASIVALAPGAVETDMLAKVIAHGGHVKTKTDISEPVSFVKNFLLDTLPSQTLNGRFIHVRDDFENVRAMGLSETKFKLRRVE